MALRRPHIGRVTEGIMQYGHFDNEKREYVIDRVDLPCSWTNYLGVEDMAAVVNHTAGGAPHLLYSSLSHPITEPLPLWESSSSVMP